MGLPGYLGWDGRTGAGAADPGGPAAVVAAFAPAVIGTDRLVLDPLRPADADAMVDLLGDERLHGYTGGRPADRAQLRRRYQRLAEGSGDPDEIWLNWIVREAAGRAPVGTVQATVVRVGGTASAEVAWVVGVPWQGRGYAGEAARALVHWLYRQGAARITANIHPDHHASARVAQRAGMAVTDRQVDGERVWSTVPGPAGDPGTPRA